MRLLLRGSLVDAAKQKTRQQVIDAVPLVRCMFMVQLQVAHSAQLAARLQCVSMQCSSVSRCCGARPEVVATWTYISRIRSCLRLAVSKTKQIILNNFFKIVIV